MVTIERVGTDTCLWCLEETEGVEAQFDDGLSGFLCKKHFWQALQVRSQADAATEKPEVSKEA